MNVLTKDQAKQVLLKMVQDVNAAGYFKTLAELDLARSAVEVLAAKNETNGRGAIDNDKT